jgi:hypothetical protein
VYERSEAQDPDRAEGEPVAGEATGSRTRASRHHRERAKQRRRFAEEHRETLRRLSK